MKNFVAGILVALLICVTLSMSKKPEPLPAPAPPVVREAPAPFVLTPIPEQPDYRAYVPPAPTAPAPQGSADRRGTFSPASGFNTPPAALPPGSRVNTGVQSFGQPRPVQRGSQLYVQPSQRPTQAQQGGTVYITQTGNKYHRAGCQYLRESSAARQLSSLGGRYTPCSRCY